MSSPNAVPQEPTFDEFLPATPEAYADFTTAFTGLEPYAQHEVVWQTETTYEDPALAQQLAVALELKFPAAAGEQPPSPKISFDVRGTDGMRITDYSVMPDPSMNLPGKYEATRTVIDRYLSLLDEPQISWLRKAWQIAEANQKIVGVTAEMTMEDIFVKIFHSDPDEPHPHNEFEQTARELMDGTASPVVEFTTYHLSSQNLSNGDQCTAHWDSRFVEDRPAGRAEVIYTQDRTGIEYHYLHNCLDFREMLLVREVQPGAAALTDPLPPTHGSLSHFADIMDKAINSNTHEAGQPTEASLRRLTALLRGARLMLAQETGEDTPAAEE